MGFRAQHVGFRVRGVRIERYSFWTKDPTPTFKISGGWNGMGGLGCQK